MKIIEDGNLNKPSLLFLPCELIPYSNYLKIINSLKNDYRIYFVSYDGHDEAERDLKFDLDETRAKIDDFFQRKNIQKIDLVYSNSLGCIVLFELFKASKLTFNKVILDEPYLNKNYSNFKKKSMVKRNTKKFLKARMDLNKYKELISIKNQLLENNDEYSISNLFKSMNIFTENTIKSTFFAMYDYSMIEFNISDDVDIVCWYDSKNKNDNSLKILSKNINKIRYVDVDDKLSKNLYFLNNDDLAKRLQLFYEIY